MTDDTPGVPTDGESRGAAPEPDPTPATDANSEKSFRPSPARIAVWVVVAGVGVYLIASGIVGMIAKG